MFERFLHSSLVSFTQRALVHVLVARRSKVSGRAGAEVVPADGVGVTVGAFLTRVTDAGVVQLTQQTWNNTEYLKSWTETSSCTL